MTLARVVNSSRASSLAIRSSSRWRKRVSTSVSPWCFSGGGRSDLASSSQLSSFSDSSPRRVRKTVPSAPSRSPRSSVEQRAQRLLAEHVDARVQLHAPGAVVEVEEGRLALAAAGVQAPGDAHAVVGLVARLERLVRRLGLGDRAHPRVGVGERLDAVLAERLELAPPGGEQLRGLFVAHA